jgi:hypothetical protein
MDQLELFYDLVDGGPQSLVSDQDEPKEVFDVLVVSNFLKFLPTYELFLGRDDGDEESWVIWVVKQELTSAQLIKETTQAPNVRESVRAHLLSAIIPLMLLIGIDLKL